MKSYKSRFAQHVDWQAVDGSVRGVARGEVPGQQVVRFITVRLVRRAQFRLVHCADGGGSGSGGATGAV